MRQWPGLKLPDLRLPELALPSLGAVNLALVSLYFLPVWGHDALTALTSPYGGFENPTHTAAAVYVREVFNLGLKGLLLTASILAVIKLVIAMAFAVYLIEFARALVTRREPDRATVDLVLLLALVAIGFWMVPALTHGDVVLLRQQAAQLLLLVGAAVVVTIEQTIAPVPATAAQPLAEARAQPLALSSSFRISPASLKAWFAAGTPQ